MDLVLAPGLDAADGAAERGAARRVPANQLSAQSLATSGTTERAQMSFTTATFATARSTRQSQQ